MTTEELTGAIQQVAQAIDAADQGASAETPAAPAVEAAPAAGGDAPQGFEVEGEFFTVNIGGVNLNLRRELASNPEQRRIAIQNAVTSKEFRQHIDAETGAPIRVRTIVGGAPPEDRLANLQRFYPSAMPYGDDNFAFVDPGTGKVTLYNPTGLDLGDVASVGRETAEFIGGSLGGAGALIAGQLGPQIATPEELVTVPVAVGAGAAAGAELFDLTTARLLEIIDTRSLGDRFGDMAEVFAWNALGQKGGDMVARGGKNLVQGLKGRASSMVQRFRQLRIDPPAGAVTSSHTVSTVETMLQNTPFAADVMQEKAERVLAQTKDAAKRIVAKIGKPETPQNIGDTVRRAAVKAAERFNFVKEQAYEDVFAKITPGAPVTLDNVRSLRIDLQKQLELAPRSLKRSYGGAINLIKSIEADAAANGNVISFEALRRIRTNLGKDLAGPQLVANAGSRNAAMKRVYAALTLDMSDTAARAGPEAAQALAVADRYTRQFSNGVGKLLDKIGKFETDEQAFSLLMQNTQKGGTTLRRMRQQFEPQEWDTIAASVLDRMGLAKPHAQDATGEAFSVNSFMTNWNNLSKEAKDALFGGTRYKDMRRDLDALVEAVGSLKGAETFVNSSNTGRVMISWMTLQATAGGLVGYSSSDGSAAGLVGGAAATILTPRMAAQLMTNPKFIRWLATPVGEASKIPAHIGRLTAIANDEPHLTEALQGFAEYVSTMSDKISIGAEDE